MARQNTREFRLREKLITTGLFLSRFDSQGLDLLGFQSFVEAFNVIGLALGAKPASIKNYRDEFDPQFPNARKGWHKRSIRHYCREVLDRYADLDIEEFARLIQSYFSFDRNQLSEYVETDRLPSESLFAQRLVTGMAAENYFETAHVQIPEFDGRSAENTTRLGCGYDFKLVHSADPHDFFAIEVKGLRDQNGTVLMTPKEYEVASRMRERFFLVVVRNFREKPFHTLFRDPIYGQLNFRRTERVLVQVGWSSTV